MTLRRMCNSKMANNSFDLDAALARQFYSSPYEGEDNLGQPILPRFDAAVQLNDYESILVLAVIISLQGDQFFDRNTNQDQLSAIKDLIIRKMAILRQLVTTAKLLYTIENKLAQHTNLLNAITRANLLEGPYLEHYRQSTFTARRNRDDQKRRLDYQLDIYRQVQSLLQAQLT